MANAKDISVEEIKLKVLIYGKSGTGKTTFACSFPRPYVFDFDNGMLSQRGKDVEYDVYDSYATFYAKLQAFEQECKYETLVFDSVTTLQKYMMNDILALNRRKEPTLHEWGSLIAGLSDLFMRVGKLPMHVVVTAHEQLLQDDLTSEIIILPLIVGKKMPNQMPLFFDEVYRAQVAKLTVNGVATADYQLLTIADTRYTAKSRLNCLSAVEKQSYEEIMKKVKGGG